MWFTLDLGQGLSYYIASNPICTAFFCFSPFWSCTNYSERKREGVQKNCWSKGWWGECTPDCPYFVDHFALAPICMWPEWRKSFKYGRVQTVLSNYMYNIQSIVNLEWQVLTWEFLGFFMLHNSACYFGGPLRSYVMNILKHFKFFSKFYINPLPKIAFLDIRDIFSLDVSQITGSCNTPVHCAQKGICNMTACLLFH